MGVRGHCQVSEDLGPELAQHHFTPLHLAEHVPQPAHAQEEEEEIPRFDGHVHTRRVASSAGSLALLARH